MVQIIKKPRTPVTIIKREAYEEDQEVQKLQTQTEEQHQQILTTAKEQAVGAKEQAMQAGADQAFAEAAAMAIDIFKTRAKLCLDLEAPMQQLVSEIVQKILGGPLSLDKVKQDSAIRAGISKMRSRRKLKIQLAQPNEFSFLGKLPDFEVEAASDVPQGFVRVVTEVGSALWAQDAAFTALKADDMVHPG